ncbi:hypothetical protein ABTZ78_17580 [Streptomyces bauhiniae]|uniref:hypothetical protein n=1 Tax=Streptomyces bauhiniae TaxID=2340725 RepID=UPI0033335CF4
MRTPDHVLIAWLAQSADDADRATTHLIEGGKAMLQLGHIFSAVRMPGQLVHGALGAELEHDVREELAERLDGAVALDPRGTGESRYYALIPPLAALTWDMADVAPALGRDTYLSTPAPYRLTPPGPHWAAPLRRENDFCRPAAVRSLLEDGLQALRRRQAAC